MRKANVGGEVRIIDANTYSVIVYEHAFAPKHAIHDDINAFMNAQHGTLVMLPLEAMLRLLYTFEHSVRTVELAPDYDAWMRELPMAALDHYSMNYDGDGWGMAVFEEVVKCFFPRLANSKDVDEEADGEGAEAEATA